MRRARWPTTVLVVAAMCATARGWSAQVPPVPEIAAVEIRGNLRVEEDAIRVHLRSRPGQPFDQAVLDEDIRAVYAMGFFDQVAADVTPGEGNRVVRLTDAQQTRIGAGYNRVLYLDPGGRVTPGTIAEGWDRRQAAESYASRRISIVDGFLTPDALAALRRFCMDSTIWFDTAHAQGGRGYIGADGMDGFACPLVFQIAEELRQALPEVIGKLPLIKLWAFKYDHALQGINAHADSAKVNVNFWITPDEACLDPSAGGMVVYDAHVPDNWSFDAYNADPRALMQHIRSVGGRAINVPYRQNRAVVFDSDLVHATAPIRFRSGYANRRINVTLLYGHRR